MAVFKRWNGTSWEIIGPTISDSRINTVEELIAPEYDPNSPYSVGDFVVHNDTLYKCNTAIGSSGELWNSTHWTETNLSRQISDIEENQIPELKSALNESEYEINKINNVLLTERVYITEPIVEHFGNYTVGNTGLVAPNSNYDAYIIELNGLQTIKVNQLGIYGFYAERPELGSISLDDTRHFDAINTNITVPEGCKYVLGANLVSAQVTVTASDPYETSTLSDDIEELQNRLILETRPVIFTKNGNNIQVRTNWTEEKDMSIRANLLGSENNSFVFSRYYLENKENDPADMTGGEVWKYAEDDITPVYFDYSYMGGGHGNDRGYRLVFENSHGFTEANIGERWTDAGNNDLVICKIESETTILCAYPNSNPEVMAPFIVVTPQSPITRNGVTKSFLSYTRGQFSPVANHVSVKAYADAKEITENGVYYGNYVDIVESYDIIHLPSMIAYLENHIGTNTNTSYYSNVVNEKYCTINNTYRFTDNGAITLFQSIDIEREIYLAFAGMVQASKIGNYCVIPLTNKKVLFNYNNADVRLSPDTWDDEQVPPNRMIQYADSQMNKGFMIGYNTEIATGTAAHRIAYGLASAGWINGSTGKLYPSLVEPYANKETMIECVSYRIPLQKYSDNIKTVGWYYVGSDVYVILDVQNSASGYVNLPDKFIGKKVEIVETSGDISLPYTVVGSQGLQIKVTGYGSAIVKLTN